MRTLSARTFETLLDESNVRENEVRPRLTNEPRYAPTARFLVRNERFAFAPNLGTPTRVSPRRRRTPPNPRATRGAFPLGTLFWTHFFWRKKKKDGPRSRLARALFRLDAPRIAIDPRVSC